MWNFIKALVEKKRDIREGDIFVWQNEKFPFPRKIDTIQVIEVIDGAVNYAFYDAEKEEYDFSDVRRIHVRDLGHMKYLGNMDDQL